jgi:hypothetical protein
VLGIDIIEDKQFLTIAYELLENPMPNGWTWFKDDS